MALRKAQTIRQDETQGEGRAKWNISDITGVIMIMIMALAPGSNALIVGLMLFLISRRLAPPLLGPIL